MDDHDFLGMLEEEQAETPLQEDLVLPLPTFDPLKHIASLLETAPRGPFRDRDASPSRLALSYLFPQDLAADLLTLVHAPDCLETLPLEMQLRSLPWTSLKEETVRVTDLPSLMSALLRDLSKVDLQQILPESPPTPPKTSLQPLYLDPTGHYLPVQPELLLASQAILSSLAGFETRLRAASTPQDLAFLLALGALTRRVCWEGDIARVNALLDTAPVAPREALLYVLLPQNPCASHESHVEKVQKYSALTKKRQEIKDELQAKATALRPPQYQETAHRVRCLLWDRLQTTFFLDDAIKTTEDYARFTEGMAQRLMERSFVPAEGAAKTKIPDWVLLRPDLTKYTYGHSRLELPPGTIGRLRKEGMFRHFETGKNFKVTPEEVIRLQRRVLPGQEQDGTIHVGDAVQMVKGEGYILTKEGSQGYVEGLRCGGEEADVLWYHLTGQEDRAVPHMFTVKLNELKLLEEDPEGQPPSEKSFRVGGNKVRIAKTSEFSGQTAASGKIVSVSPLDEDLPYTVRFTDGIVNRYGTDDLEFLKPSKQWRKAEQARKAAHQGHDAFKVRLEAELPGIFREAEKGLCDYRDTLTRLVQDYQTLLPPYGISSPVISSALRISLGDALDDPALQVPPDLCEALDEFLPGLRPARLLQEIFSRVGREFGIFTYGGVTNKEGYDHAKPRLYDIISDRGYEISDQPLRPPAHAVLIRNSGIGRNYRRGPEGTTTTAHFPLGLVGVLDTTGKFDSGLGETRNIAPAEMAPLVRVCWEKAPAEAIRLRLRLPALVTEVERQYKGAKDRWQDLAVQGLSELCSLGYSRAALRTYLKSNLASFKDLEKAGLI